MKTAETVNPATEETIETLALASRADVERALERADRAFAAWRRTSLAERGALLRAVAARLRADSEALAHHAVLEMGKPIAQARAEIAKCAWGCEHFAEHAASMLRDEPATSDAAESYVAYDPIGAILAVMPWNFPYWQVFRAAAPMLMAGNVVLLKHALNVSRCALEIESVFARAGAPAGVFQTLVIDHDAIASIVADDRIVAATLTGSERAGISLASAAGGVLKKTVLELGGSDPFIVLADADVDAAVEAGVRARFQNTGQSCIAAKRFLIEKPVFDAFTSRFVDATRALVVGDPLSEKTGVGPLARGDLRDELEAQVTRSIDAGARALVGGKRPTGKGYYYEPTVLVDVPADAPALTEELFGPVAPIVAVRDADEAIAIANASRFGLSANLWTRDIARAKRVAREIDAGGVFVNGMTVSDPRLPFGGVKKSGYGRELAAFGLREFVNVKTIAIGPFQSPAKR